MFYLETGCRVAQAGLDLLCSPNWPQIPYVAKASLQLIVRFSLPHAATPSIYAVLGIKPESYTCQTRILPTDLQHQAQDFFPLRTGSCASQDGLEFSEDDLELPILQLLS